MMDISKEFPVGHEFKDLVVLNPKATDPRRKFGFEPQFIPQRTRKRDRTFFGDYYDDDPWGDLGSSNEEPVAKPETYMVIFRIDDLGDRILQPDEEWRLKISHTHLSDPALPRTADGRRKFYVWVNLVERVEEISDWKFVPGTSADTGNLTRTVRSGKLLLRTDKLSATRKRMAYRTENYVIETTEINAKDGMHQFTEISVISQRQFLDNLSRRYGNAVSPDALRRRLANVPPAPQALLNEEYVKNYLAATAKLDAPWQHSL